jgi:hypothetical protein
LISGEAPLHDTSRVHVRIKLMKRGAQILAAGACCVLGACHSEVAIPPGLFPPTAAGGWRRVVAREVPVSEAPDPVPRNEIERYEPVVGLEVHVQLATATKIFCGCPTSFRRAAQHQRLPGVPGLPGALPVLNRAAVELAIKGALALNCRIRPVSRFARKNYFYPDLPKGYQISQYDEPLAEHGWVDIEWTARPSASASPASTWKTTPARASTKASRIPPLSPTWTSIAAARR